ncbi:hypothetical protein A7P96_00540 [Eikenella sp. NML03-A-027]|uniref:KilA-N domain-containing protein n=1 Tax=Eikenella sp. NML03-A-027 TaxID=1795828 RepID=UPI0007E228F8|nr:KilA-N domain-containing protein [Eikenella sp. NML03-A-027]OAM33232.1 hypothetical protein A7P96_00540 [Eikenella sp. NML03-A-027]
MNTQIVIANRVIRRHGDLYCLNDLHKASGGEKRHRPSYWLALKQTSEIIEELNKEAAKAEITALKQNQQVIQSIHGGKQHGTFACKELVYAYAAWISPQFFLQVLRTYDAAISGSLPQVQGWRPPLLPLRPPRDYAAACALADETLREVNALNMRVAKVEHWLTYWRDVFIEDALAGTLPE